jgi:hypothetical protein
VRIVILNGLRAGVIAVFAPQQGAGLMGSAVHRFGWRFGRGSCIRFLVITIGDAAGGLPGNGARERKSGLRQRIGNGKGPPIAEVPGIEIIYGSHTGRWNNVTSRTTGPRSLAMIGSRRLPRTTQSPNQAESSTSGNGRELFR